MGSLKNKVGKFKDWIIPDDENNEEYDNYDEEYDDYEEYDESYEEEYEEHTTEKQSSHSGFTSSQSRVTDYSSHNQMKVVILEPRVYDDAQTIADNLKLRKTVIVNLNSIDDKGTRRSIFDFMNGAVYVLDGSIQLVEKYIYILAPKNVDVDSNIKKELESKAIFPWQSK